MRLIFCKEGLNMVIIDQTMGEQMLEVCHAAEVANKVPTQLSRDLVTGYTSCNWSPQTWCYLEHTI